MPGSSSYRTGVWLGITAYTVWGLSPIFWNLVEEVPPIEVLAHRVLWAIPILLVVVAIRQRWTALRAAYRNPRTVAIAILGGAVLMVNWGVFLWAVTSGHIVEISLGYFINPLVSVALGVLVLRERLRPGQWLAVAIAGAGVLSMAIMLGVPPWISLTLALTFGFYGLLKKQPAAARALEGLLGEVATMAIPVLILLGILASRGESSFNDSPTVAAFLIGAGIMTVGPLLLFGAAAQRIPLTMVGLLQYLAPTLQLIVALTIYNETLSGPDVVGFVMVWIALAVYTTDNIRHARQVRALSEATQ